MGKTLSIAIILTFLSFFAKAEVGIVTGLNIPRFISLKSSETNLRKGPNTKYPIVWTYKQKGYPLEVVAEFENWRKLRDRDGSEGWAHENLITGVRNVVIANNAYLASQLDYPKVANEIILFRYPDEDSYPMLRAEIGTIGKVKSCDAQWCKIRIDDVSGWIRKSNLWGVYENEVFK